MKRDEWCVWKLVTTPLENIEAFTLSDRIAGIGLEDQRQWRETVPALVRERSAQLVEKAQPG